MAADPIVFATVRHSIARAHAVALDSHVRLAQLTRARPAAIVAAGAEKPPPPPAVTIGRQDCGCGIVNCLPSSGRRRRAALSQSRNRAVTAAPRAPPAHDGLAQRRSTTDAARLAAGRERALHASAARTRAWFDWLTILARSATVPA